MDGGMKENFHSMLEGAGETAPVDIWSPEKVTQTFQGGLVMTGGSLPEEGHGPFDDHPPAARPTNAGWVGGMGG